MRRNKSRNRAKLAPLAAACALTVSGYAWGQNFITDTWAPSPGVNLDWEDPSLWSTGTVPNDDSTNKYVVTLPGSQAVWIDNDPPYTVPATSATVYDLNMGNNATLNVYLPLTVEDAINGYGANVNVIGTTLTLATPPAGTAFPANISVQSGGTAALAYSSLNLGNNNVALSADGAGSVLDLHTVQTFIYGVNGGQNVISATNGGTINLSGVTALQNSAYYGSLFLQAGGGGTINLNNVQTVGFGGQSPTYFRIANGYQSATFSLPSLTGANYAQFEMPTGMTITAPNLTTVINSTINLSGGTFTTGSLADIDATSINVSGGATFNSVSATSYSMGNNSNVTVSADGAGSVLDLHTVQTLIYGVNGGQNVISATNGGTINLSGVTALQNSAYYGSLFLQTGGGGTINLNNVQSIGFGGQSPTTFQIANGSQTANFSLPQLTAANYVQFEVPTGMTVDAPKLTTVINSTINLSGGTFTTGSLADIDATSINVSGGATFNSVSATSYSMGNNSNVTVSADGAGSVVDLHTVQTLIYGVNGGQNVISATNGGTINLSGVTALQNNAYYGSLFLQTGGGGTINLNNVQSIGFGGQSPTTFQIANGSQTANFSLPQLTAANYVQFEVPTGMTVDAPKLTTVIDSTINLSGGTFTTGSLADIDATSINVSGGATFNSVSATSYSMGNNSNVTVSADGAGSVLDLHTVQTLIYGVNGGQNVISATNGGTINLSGVTNLENNAYYGSLNIQASSGGTINLANLQNIGMTGQSPATFNVATNGTISIGGPVQTQYAQFNISDPTGNLIFQSNVNLGSTSSLNLTSGAILQVKGSFSTTITNTSAFQASGAILNMDGNGLQTLEVAGADEGAVNPGNNGNFGFGQLDVGTPTVPTEVDLVDDVNNGNRGAGNANEALYLYGVNGQGGLVLNGGSVLLIGNLNAYSFQDGSWTDLQNLFTGGETIVSYTLNGSDGYIARNLSALQAVWQNPGSGGWNTGTNWNINTTPGIFNDVFITPVTGVTVTGPTASTRIRSLTIDATPSGTLSVLNLSSASTITVEDNIDIGSQGQINEQAGTLTAQQMTVAGSFAQSANTTLNVSGGLTSTGGITSAGSFTVGGAFVNNGTYIQSAGTANIGSVSGTGSTNIGPGVTLNVGNFTQLGGLVSSGTVNINGGGTVKSITGNGALSIEGGTLQLAVNAGLNSVSSLSIGANAALDIGNSRLLINYGSGKDPIASIAAWIENGFFGLPGPAIVSSDIAGADAASGLSYGIGYADSADPGNPADLPSGTVEIMFTLLGDANLDGTVNSEDFTPFSHNLGQSGMMWDDGDFNYDGTVNAEDFTPFSHNLNQSAVLAAQIGVFDATANGTGLANVPEPACAGMMVMAGLGIMRRRRRAK